MSKEIITPETIFFSEYGRYPNRYKEIHKVCCKNCPSDKDRSDPKSEELKKLPSEYLVDHVFPCAWRPSKLCKGVCDNYGVNEKLISDCRKK